MSMRRQLLTHFTTLVINDLEKAYERLLVYACVGGMPGYLRRFDRQTAGENVLDANLPLRDEATAEPVLYALAGTVEEVIDATGLSFHATTACLRYLDAHNIVTVDQFDTRNTISHPLLHCYRRFVDPHVLLVTRGEVARAWHHMESSLVAYAGTTVLARLTQHGLQAAGSGRCPALCAAAHSITDRG